MKPYSIVHVSGSLYLSNKVWLERDLEALHRYGIGAIVNLVEDHRYQVPAPLVCLDAGFPDGVYVASETLESIYTFIASHGRNTNVLVHCSAGVSRSAAVAIGWLLLENPGWTWDQALGVLSDKRAVWVSAEMRESVTAYLSGRATSRAASEIQGNELQALRLLERSCGIALQEVSSVGWNTRGYVVEEGQVVELGLYDLRLLAIPEAIFHLTKLRALYLCDNALADLPERIPELGQLETFNLSGNRLSSLPEEIGALPCLRVLNLGHNQMRRAPEGLGRLRTLDRLYLHGNRLSRLPDSLGELTGIRELCLQKNFLGRLPENLGQLSRLESLSVDTNALETLPSALWTLRSLTALGLGKNRLQSLPDDLGNLSALDNLNLSSNQLRSLPDGITALRRLRRLNIALNAFEPLSAACQRWLSGLESRGCVVIRGDWFS